MDGINRIYGIYLTTKDAKKATKTIVFQKNLDIPCLLSIMILLHIRNHRLEEIAEEKGK